MKEELNTIHQTEENEQVKKSMKKTNLHKSRESSASEFVRVCEALARQGFDFSNFTYSKTSEKNGKKKQIGKTLKDIQEENTNIDMEQVLKETGVKIDYPIGMKRYNTKTAISEKNGFKITEKEKDRLIELGVINLESSMSEFVRVCEALKKQGLNLSKITYTKWIVENGRKRYVVKTLADLQSEYPNIDIEQVAKDTGVRMDYSIGEKRHSAMLAISQIGRYKITEVEKRRLIQLGVISENKETSISEFVRVCEALSKQGFDFSNFTYSKTVKQKGKRKTVGKTLKDIEKENPNIDIKQVLKIAGVRKDYPIREKRKTAIASISGKGSCIITEEEKERLIELGVIKLKTAQEIGQATFDAPVEECDAAQTELNRLIEKQNELKEGGITKSE